MELYTIKDLLKQEDIATYSNNLGYVENLVSFLILRHKRTSQMFNEEVRQEYRSRIELNGNFAWDEMSDIICYTKKL